MTVARPWRPSSAVLRRLVAGSASAGALAAALTACTGAGDADRDASPPTPERSATAAPTPTRPPPWVTRPPFAAPDPRRIPAEGEPRSTAPAPGSMDVPTTRVGGLDRRAFPRPEDLGPSWTYRVDDGDAEEGYAGNGTPTLARDPREVAQTAVPFGCPRPAEPLPVPEAALEVDYTAGGDWVVSVRSTFADAATARRFHDLRRDALAACRGRSGGAAVGPYVSRLVDLDAATVLSDRTPRSDGYAELSAVIGDDVVLVARRTDTQPTLRTARALAAAFRGRPVPGGIP